MRKAFRKPVALMIIVSVFCGCMPKYTIKYDVIPSEKKIVEFDKHKLGILEFEDTRPIIELEGSSGNTISLSDGRFDQPVPEMVTDIMVKHFDANQGQKGRILRIMHNTKSINLDLLDKIKKEGISDYVLLGNIKHYTANLYDYHFGKRMVGSFFAGFTVIGLVFMPLILAGNVDVNTEIEFDNIMLVKVDGPQILWKGRAYNSSKGETLLFTANNKDLIGAYEANTKKTIQGLYNNIMLSYELGFPQKYSIEDSKKILSYIKLNGSLTNMNF